MADGASAAEKWCLVVWRSGGALVYLIYSSIHDILPWYHTSVYLVVSLSPPKGTPKGKEAERGKRRRRPAPAGPADRCRPPRTGTREAGQERASAAPRGTRWKRGHMSSVADLDALFAEAKKRKKKKRLQRDKRSDDDRAPTLSDVFVTGAKEEVPVRLATEGTLGSRLEGGATAGYSSSAPRAPSASVLYRRVAEGDAAQFAGARMDVGAHVLSLLQSHMGDTEANRAMERKLQNRTLALEGRRRGKDSAGGSKVAWAERSSRGDARLPTHVKSLSGKKRKALDRQEGG